MPLSRGFRISSDSDRESRDRPRAISDAPPRVDPYIRRISVSAADLLAPRFACVEKERKREREGKRKRKRKRKRRDRRESAHVRAREREREREKEAERANQPQKTGVESNVDDACVFGRCDCVHYFPHYKGRHRTKPCGFRPLAVLVSVKRKVGWESSGGRRGRQYLNQH